MKIAKIHFIFVLLTLLNSVPAFAVCQFSGDEYTNPFDASCGGQILTYVESDSSQNPNTIPLGYPVPIPVDTMSAIDGFRTYAGLHAKHQNLMTLNADVEGTIVGQTLSGNDIWAYRIGDLDLKTARDSTQEPAVMVNGGIHANEWQTPEVLTEIFEQLVEIQNDGGFGQYLKENLNVILLPVQNIDGIMQTQRFPATTTANPLLPKEGRMRRKNLRSTSDTLTLVDRNLDTIEDNFDGVDLNRNNMQGFGLGGSSNVAGRRYRGPIAASEPETRALLAAAALAPENRLRLFMDIHSFGQFYYGQDNGNERLTKITTELATRMRAVTGFKYDWQIDPNDGGYGMTNQIFTYMHQIPSWGIEVEPKNGGSDYGGTDAPRSGFIVPDREISRIRDELARTSLLGFYRQTGPPSIEAVQITDTSTNQPVFDARWTTAVKKTRTLIINLNKALQAGSEYKLWLAFDKPMRWRNKSGQVTNFDGQNVVTFPTITLEVPTLENRNISINEGGAAWLNTSGGAPDGFYRYADDALTVNFTIPDDFSEDDQIPMILSVNARDLSQAVLDSNPATAVDFADGHWIGYENSENIDGDVGGADCSIRPFVGLDENSLPPQNNHICRVTVRYSGDDNNGGGSINLLMLLILTIFAFISFLNLEKLLTPKK